MAQYYKPELNDSKIDVSSDEVNKFLGGEKTLAASGYQVAKPTMANLPGYEWTRTQYGDWAETPISPQNLTSQANDLGIASSALPDISKELQNIEDERQRVKSEEETRRQAGRERIESQFGQRRAELETAGEKTLGGARTQLGEARGLGFSSSRGQYLEEIRRENEKLISDLESRKAEAMTNLDFESADRETKRISNLREQSFNIRKQVLDERYRMAEEARAQEESKRNETKLNMDISTRYFDIANSLPEGRTYVDPNTGTVITGIKKEANELKTSLQTADGRNLMITYDMNGNIVNKQDLGSAYKGMGENIGGGGSILGGVYKGKKIDFNNPAEVNTLPISTISKAIISGYGNVKELTPTDKSKVIAELYSVGYDPKKGIMDKLDNLIVQLEKVSPYMRGVVQGYTPSTWDLNAANFESAKIVLTRQIARLYDVGMLSDQDVADYKKAMPARSDWSLGVSKAKVAGLKTAVGAGETEANKENVEIKTVNGKTYEKVEGGWKLKQ